MDGITFIPMAIEITYTSRGVTDFSIEGKTLTECMHAMRKCALSRKKGSLKNITGLPLFIKHLAENWFSHCTVHEKEYFPFYLTNAALLDEYLVQVPLLRSARAVVLGTKPVSDRLREALAHVEFIEVCRVSGFPLPLLAQSMETAGLGDQVEIMDDWDRMLFGSPAHTTPSMETLEHLHAALRACTHGHSVSAGTEGIPHHGEHAWDSGACALFAVTLDRVLENGGRYLALAGRRFNHETSRGCDHVAIRVGNMVADGNGVHSVRDFLTKWTSRYDTMHEFTCEPNEGVLKAMCQCRARGMLDAGALEADLRRCGVGPWMLRTVSEELLPSDTSELEPTPTCHSVPRL